MSEGGRDLRVEVREVPARRRVLSAALALELVWLMLTAAVVVSLAAHLGSADEVGVDPASDRLLVYLVPPMTVVVGLALLGARRAIDRRGPRRASPAGTASPALRSRLALWVVAAANGGLAIAIATSLYHAEVSWVVLGGAILAIVVLIMVGCVTTAHSRR